MGQTDSQWAESTLLHCAPHWLLPITPLYLMGICTARYAIATTIWSLAALIAIVVIFANVCLESMKILMIKVPIACLAFGSAQLIGSECWNPWWYEGWKEPTGLLYRGSVVGLTQVRSRDHGSPTVRIQKCGSRVLGSHALGSVIWWLVRRSLLAHRVGRILLVEPTLATVPLYPAVLINETASSTRQIHPRNWSAVFFNFLIYDIS